MQFLTEGRSSSSQRDVSIRNFLADVFDFYVTNNAFLAIMYEKNTLR